MRAQTRLQTCGNAAEKATASLSNSLVPVSSAEIMQALAPYITSGPSGLRYTSARMNHSTLQTEKVLRTACEQHRCPVFESLDITPVLRLRPQSLREAKFVLDVHLGRLAGYLRMFGFDTVYSNCASDPELVKISVQQGRITTDPNGLMQPLHNRMPVILRGQDYQRWVETCDPTRLPIDPLRPYDTDEMKAWKVNARVGNVRNNDPECAVGAMIFLCSPRLPVGCRVRSSTIGDTDTASDRSSQPVTASVPHETKRQFLSGFQFHSDQLKRRLAHVFRGMFCAVQVSYVTCVALHFNDASIGERVATLMRGKEYTDERWVIVHRRFLVGSITDAELPSRFQTPRCSAKDRSQSDRLRRRLEFPWRNLLSANQCSPAACRENREIVAFAPEFALVIEAQERFQASTRPPRTSSVLQGEINSAMVPQSVQSVPRIQVRNYPSQFYLLESETCWNFWTA